MSLTDGTPGNALGGLACTSFVAVRHPVVNGNRMHFVGLQLVRNHPHLLVDVVLPHTLCEGGELAFEVRDVLAAQRRGAEFLGARAMTGGARRDPTLRIPGKNQADRRIALPKTAPALRSALSGN